MPDERIAQLCALGKLDGPTWMAKIHAERAESPAERQLWRSTLERLGAVAAVLAVVAITIPAAHAGNHMEINHLHGASAEIMHIM